MKYAGRITRRKFRECEARALNYDTSRGPIFRYFTEAAFVDVEISTGALFICNTWTDERARHQGHATALFNELAKLKKRIVAGCYSDEGERYLKPLIDRLNLNLS